MRPGTSARVAISQVAPMVRDVDGIGARKRRAMPASTLRRGVTCRRRPISAVQSRRGYRPANRSAPRSALTNVERKADARSKPAPATQREPCVIGAESPRWSALAPVPQNADARAEVNPLAGARLHGRSMMIGGPPPQGACPGARLTTTPVGQLDVSVSAASLTLYVPIPPF